MLPADVIVDSQPSSSLSSSSSASLSIARSLTSNDADTIRDKLFQKHKNAKLKTIEK